MSEGDLGDLATAALNAIITGWPTFPDSEWPHKAALPDSAFVALSLPAWDCEQLVVSTERTFGSEGSPSQERIVPIGDGVPWLRVLVLSIQIVRCCATVDANIEGATFPAAQVMTDEALTILTDADLVLHCLIRAQARNELAGCGGIALENWKALPEQGGLHGGLTRVRLATF
jgi:hypothetical protein